MRAKTIASSPAARSSQPATGGALRISCAAWAANPGRRLVAQVVERGGGRCWLCGRPGADGADHVVRLRDGGTDELENFRAAHVACNRRRA